MLAKKSPAVLDAITQHPPVVGINGLAAITFMVGYLLFGLAMIRTASLPRLAGILVAVGAPAHLIGFGLAQLTASAGSSWVVIRCRGLARLRAGRRGGRRSTTFMVTGVLFVVFAVSLREALPGGGASKLAAALLGLLGVALILAAFPVDVPMLTGGHRRC